MLGTKNYTAPEYLLGSGASNRSDLFSLGVITYEMLTGRLPYGDALSRNSTARRLRKLTYASARDYRDDLPLWIDGALAKAVCLEASGRYAAMSEFLFDLSHPNSEFMRPRARQPLLERHPLRFWQALSALLLLGNVLLAYWLVGR